jgi:hypothetical protein
MEQEAHQALLTYCRGITLAKIQTLSTAGAHALLQTLRAALD